METLSLSSDPKVSVGETVTTIEGMTAVFPLCTSTLIQYKLAVPVPAQAQPAMSGLFADRTHTVQLSDCWEMDGVLRMRYSTSMTSFTFINPIAKKMTRRTREPTNQVGVALIAVSASTLEDHS